MLYLSLVRSQLVYCLQVWRPSLVEEIKTFEDVQRSATKFILNDYISDYRTHRLKLHMQGGGIGVAGAAMAAPLFSSNMATPYDHALID